MGLLGDVGNFIKQGIRDVGRTLTGTDNNPITWVGDAAVDITGAVIEMPGNLPITGDILREGQILDRNIANQLRRDRDNIYDVNYQLAEGADWFLGELTGRNLANEQLDRQRQMIRQEDIERERLREEERLTREREDIAASRGAMMRRGWGTSRSRGTRSSSSSSGTLQTANSLGVERDFLGL